jgi:hypothetical protein
MRAPVIVELDPVADGARCGLDSVDVLAMHATFFERPNYALDHSLMLRTAPLERHWSERQWRKRGDELLLQPEAAHQHGVFPLVMTRPLSDLRRNSCGTFSSVPHRLIRACSKALAAVLAFPKIVSEPVVQDRRPPERSETDQVAAASSLTVGVSVTRARVSSDIWRRATAHSSLVSGMSAPTSRTMAPPRRHVRRVVGRSSGVAPRHDRASAGGARAS